MTASAGCGPFSRWAWTGCSSPPSGFGVRPTILSAAQYRVALQESGMAVEEAPPFATVFPWLTFSSWLAVRQRRAPHDGSLHARAGTAGHRPSGVGGRKLL